MSSRIWTLAVCPQMFLEKGRNLSGSYELRASTTGRVVAPRVELAITRASRRQGLLGRDGLDAGHALILAPCTSVHTFFMRFAIDVIFVRRDGEILKIRPDMTAWRLSGSFGAYATVEMQSGAAARAGLKPGDRLELVPSP